MKRIFAAMLSAFVIFGLCACSGIPDAPSTQPTQSVTEAASPTAEATKSPTAAPTPTPEPTPTQEVFLTFSDAGFEARLRDYLNVSASHRITVNELYGVDRLFLSGEDIYDLSDAKKLPALQQLTLSGTPNADLSTLSTLGRLTGLAVINCGDYDDISFLRLLGGLKDLTLDSPAIKDYSPVSGLHLTSLNLRNASSFDPSLLSHMSSLQCLALSGCGLTDVSFVGGLTGLEELSLDDNYISDISPLSALKNLRYLNLKNNCITEFETLFDMRRLTEANISFNHAGTERLDELSTLLEKRGGALSFYPTDREGLARWPIDLDGDGTDEYFCFILDWLMDDFISLAWVENADCRLLGQEMQCGTGHVVFCSFAVVNSPEYGVCLMRLSPEFGGQNYGYELMTIVDGRLQTVRSVSFYYYGGDSDNLIDPEDAAEYEAEVNALLESGRLLFTTDRWGVMQGTFINKLTGKEFTLGYTEGVTSAFISAYGSVGNGIATHRAEMEADGFVFCDEPVTYRLVISREYMAE